MHGEQGYTQRTPYGASDMFNGCVFLGFAVTAIALARCHKTVARTFAVL